ncbi:MAG: hypothetical protein OXM55_07525 [Bdellovibrionales bacterium]|nr:hypothetical protein [Bdellovibrionales bacterium]
MNKQLDVLSVKTYTDKDGNEKKKFIPCGIAFPRKKEEGYVVKLDLHNSTGDYLLSQKKEWKES